MSAASLASADPSALIVEDEAKLALLLSRYLGAAGFSTQCLADGRQVVGTVRDARPTVILLDLMLPGRNGLEVCQELRSFTDVPILIISARVDEVDRLVGLGIGADDYICKPFSPREVVARVKAILRRASASQPTVDPTSHTLTIDSDRHTVTVNSRTSALTAIELRLLQVLAASPGRVFTRSQLIDKLYSEDRAVTDRTVDSHIRNLRKRLQHLHPEHEIVRSVYGVGYKLEADVRVYEHL